MSSLVQVPSRSGWPHDVRGAAHLGSLTFAAVVSAGIARSADGVRSGAPPRPPPPPAPPPPRPPCGACAAGALAAPCPATGAGPWADSETMARAPTAADIAPETVVDLI